jgi:TRAP-type C4-dicarboxylate transport system permease small subunit
MDRAWSRLMAACGALAALALGAMALLVTADVLIRNLTPVALPWVLELSEYSLPFATFLAAPWILYRNQHVRLDVLLTALPARTARWLERVVDAVGLAISLLLLWYGFAALADSWRQDSLVIKALTFAEWWLFVPLVLCFALLSIEFVRRLVRPGGPAPLLP